MVQESIQNENSLLCDDKSLLMVSNLHKTYKNKKDKSIVKALNDVSFSLKKGQVLGIIGESGCGKSTLAKVLTGLEKPDSGYVEFQGKPLKEMLKKREFRRKCQMIFQNPFDSFDPKEKIGTILIDAMKIHGIGNNGKHRLELCKTYLENYGLKPAEEFMDRYTFQLSGGQLQRIGILRAMILEPQLLIADEAVSMLDVSVRADIINLLLELVSKNQTSLIFISHDIATTWYIADFIAVMYFGKIVEIGSRQQIVNKPRHSYTKLLISSCGTVRNK
ncbi:peptide/nickel transport system ATP-binding protein [Hathewaya proteolytica DSM 3090]|uniref:Peptide/nickel transport system ATP-binding protein n=1 Tax=Hathewaya proteolytica DSM 3090 TaxID=1121331 RepID=A0A1M6PKA8_9CLOT|nr:ATP-binding cassette domain-containing protein [Hathewaya proteolytica]SHK08399.1 peptide/nickel transport system ATP-binding protein [Hathewaya proteolytica DSM 3090]